MKPIILSILLIVALDMGFCQELRIYSHGSTYHINTGRASFMFPDSPNDENVRYVEFSDFVLKVFVSELSASSEDTIGSDETGPTSIIPVYLVAIDSVQIYYRFTLDADENNDLFDTTILQSTITNRTDTVISEIPSDSTVTSIKQLLVPKHIKLPQGSSCLVWVDALHKDCYYVREVVSENTIFINRSSDYAGSICPVLKSYHSD